MHKYNHTVTQLQWTVSEINTLCNTLTHTKYVRTNPLVARTSRIYAIYSEPVTGLTSAREQLSDNWRPSQFRAFGWAFCARAAAQIWWKYASMQTNWRTQVTKRTKWRSTTNWLGYVARCLFYEMFRDKDLGQLEKKLSYETEPF